MSFGFIPDPGLFSVAIPPFASDIWKDLFGTIKGQMLEISSLYDIDTSRTRGTPTHSWMLAADTKRVFAIATRGYIKSL